MKGVPLPLRPAKEDTKSQKGGIRGVCSASKNVSLTMRPAGGRRKGGSKQAGGKKSGERPVQPEGQLRIEKRQRPKCGETKTNT